MACSSTYIDLERCNLIPFSLSPSLSSKTLFLNRLSSSPNSLIFADSTRTFRILRATYSNHRRIITCLAHSQSFTDSSNSEEGLSSEAQHKASQLKKRVVFGLGIGVCVGGVVLAGGWVFTVALAAAVFAGAREYFELVRSRGIAAGMTPPPRFVSRVCSVICALMPLVTLYMGQIDVSVTSAAFIVAMTLLLQRGPRFSQLSSAMFGLFYCGYLPCFWVKLRCGLATPALNTSKNMDFPVM
ncbi:hypothetical protein AgCh_034222 [Apium graveolens]